MLFETLDYSAGMSDAAPEPATPGAASVSQKQPRVAVIDRDRGLVQVLANRLDARGWAHRELPAPPSSEALTSMQLSALVLDVALLGGERWEYLERVCGCLPSVAVVVCTGTSSVAQRVRGLRAGADAWVTKPCHAEELVCLIEAVIRRRRSIQLPQVGDALQAGEMTIRSDLHQAFVRGRSVELTAREFEILVLLARAGRILRREEIYERVWGYSMVHGDRSVDVFVRKLRRKLQAASPDWSYIHTHFGVGYRFAAEPAAGAGASDASGSNSERPAEFACTAAP